MSNRKAVLIVGGIVLVAIVVGALCIGWMRQPTPAPVLDPCKVNPTRTTVTGEWVEADGEPLDEDPCDSDDFNEKKKYPATTKPAPGTTAKTPAPVRTTRRR